MSDLQAGWEAAQLRYYYDFQLLEWPWKNLEEEERMRGLKEELMALLCWRVEEQILMEEMEVKVLATLLLVEVGNWGKALLGH